MHRVEEELGLGGGDRRRGCRDRRAGLTRKPGRRGRRTLSRCGSPGSRRSRSCSGEPRHRRSSARSRCEAPRSTSRTCPARRRTRRSPSTRRDPNVLLAGLEQLPRGTQRIYSSTDGGLTWKARSRSRRADDLQAACPSDPGVAIDLTGRQYYSYDRATPCNAQGSSRVYVLARPGPSAAWSQPVLVAKLGTRALRRQAGDRRRRVRGEPAQKPRLRRLVARRPQHGSSIVLSHSDDGGRTWSAPVRVSGPGERRRSPTSRSPSPRNGTVYVAWTDETHYSVRIARSTDGGRHFGPRAAGGRVLDHPDPALRHRHRRRGRAALVHPGRPDRRRRHLRRALQRPRLRQLHGHELHRGRGRVALDLRQPAQARRRLSGDDRSIA